MMNNKKQLSYFGSSIQINNIIIFFGNKHSANYIWQNHFPYLDFFYLNQIHGNTIINRTKKTNTADGCYSKYKNEALCIITADCLPIMLWEEKSKYIFAIHAGWRGLEQKIINKLLQFKNICSLKNLKAFIGPHIDFNKFETNEDIANQLLSTINFKKNTKLKLHDICQPAFKTKKNNDHPNKFYLNLFKIAQIQLINIGLNPNNIFRLNIDTFSNKNYFSFRRNKKKDKKYRQINFITQI